VTTLIVGCGYVGSALAELLVGRERVIALTRSPRALPEGVEPLIATLPETTPKLPNGIRRVVYAVAPDERTEAAYERAYPAGVRAVARALDRTQHALQRFVLVSSTAVYAEDAGGLVDARTPLARGPTNEAIARAETCVHELAAEMPSLAHDGAYGVVARLSGIYGPGRDRIVRAIREGRTTGDPSRIGNRIHRDDAAAALAHLLEVDRPDRTYDVTDTASVPMGEVFEWIARRVGVALDPALTTVGPARTGKRIDPTRLLSTGFSFRYPTYREGYGALVAATR
jgi:nucleoside-diphosphate-sugar epimerase